MNKHSLHHGGTEPALRILAMPAHTNPFGDIFGGWIMSQVDMAGAVIATKRARSRVATIAVTDFLFKKPVLVGDLISCYAHILKVGRTSITVKVEVCALRNDLNDDCIKVTEATVVYVAIGDNNQTKEIPKDD